MAVRRQAHWRSSWELQRVAAVVWHVLGRTLWEGLFLSHQIILATEQWPSRKTFQ